MNTQEPPNSNSLSRSLFLIGRNSRGQWVVRNQCGTRGGLFIDRVQALKFAMFENGHRPQAVIMVPGVLELDINNAMASSDPGAKPARTRQAA